MVLPPKLIFEGIYTALITPFDPIHGGIDEKTFCQLIEKQIQADITGIVVGGSTGEGQVLTVNERKCILNLALTYKNELQILGAVGHSSTQQALDDTQRIADAGAYGVLISSPPYNKPPQRGLIEHFKVLSSASSLPIMVYNIPGRTGVHILPETIL